MAASMRSSRPFHSSQTFLRSAQLDPSTLLEPLTESATRLIQQDGEVSDKIEQASSLLAVVDELARRPTHDSRGRVGDDGDDQSPKRPSTTHALLERVITGVCIPSLKSARPGDIRGRGRDADFQLVHIICELTMSCLCFPNDGETQALRDILFMMCMKSLQTYCTTVKLSHDDREKTHETEDNIHVFTALELLNYFFEVSEKSDEVANPVVIPLLWSDRLFKEILHILDITRDKTVCSRIVGILLPKLLSHNPKLLPKRLELLWKQISSCPADGVGIHGNGPVASSTSYHGNTYLSLCGMADFFFPASGNLPADIPDLKSLDLFWNIVQTGMKHTDSLTRKRAMYLLKRVLDTCSKSGMEVRGHRLDAGDSCPMFWWSVENGQQLQDVWEDIILMLEALDETQLHVFKPLMPRLKNVVKATYHRDAEWSYLHSSWLTVLFQRCFVHENKNHVVKWSLLEFLRLDFKHCPLLSQGNREFIYDTLLNAIHESIIYGRIGPQDSESKPSAMSPVGSALIGFFKSCMESFDDDTEKVDFVVRLLPAIQNHKGWGTVPMTFLCQALANIPACKAWDWTSLKRMREIIASLVTFPTHLRSALSCYLMETTLNLINSSQVTLHQFTIVIATVECLQRGSLLWKQLVDWLRVSGQDFKLEDGCNSLADVLLNFVRNCLDAKMKDESSTTGSIDPGHLAKILLLVSDAHFSATDEKGLLSGKSGDYPTALNWILHPLQDILSRLYSHAYLPSDKADQTLKLLLAILQEISADKSENLHTDKTTTVVIYMVEQCIEETLSYIMSKIATETSELSHVARLNLCVDIVEVLSSLTHRGLFGLNSSTEYILQAQIAKMGQLASKILAEKSEDLSMQNQIKKLVAVSCLWCFCHFHQKTATNSQIISDPVRAIVTGIDIKHRFERPADSVEVSKRDLGRLISLYENKRWSCVYFLVDAFSGVWNDHHDCGDLLTECVSVLSIVSGPAILSLIKCMQLLIQQVLPKNPSLCVDCIDVTWRLVYDVRTDSGLFWLAYQTMIDTVFQNCVLAMPPNTDVSDKLHKIAMEICDIAEQKPGVLYFLISRYSQYVLSVSERGDSNVDTDVNHIDLLVQGCLYGPIHRKDARTSQDSITLLKMNSEGKPASEVADSIIKQDCHVRAAMVSTLVTMVTKKPNGMSALAKRLCQDLLQKASEVTKARKHYLLNSSQHRIKQRIWQTILVLQPCFDKDMSEFMLKEAIAALSLDTQLSVKNLEEWFIVLILRKYPEFHNIIWQVIEEDCEKTVNLMSSLISVLAILGPIIEDKKDQEAFMHRALTLTMTHTMAGNFTIRLYAQAALQKLWTVCEQSQLTDLMQTYPGFQKCIQFLRDSRHTDRLKERLLGNFFLFKFDPIKDYSVETIFHTLPFLCSVIEEELIKTQVFQEEELKSGSAHGDWAIPLFNGRDDLKTCEPGTWKVRGPMTYSPSTNDDAEANVNTGDVQKKITPWTETLLSQDTDAVGSHGNRREGKLVLVTSLIDKLPNLGGLCRTSEIFGVGTLVLGNLRYTESQEFQSLSVTAEKWLTLQEVKPSSLRGYLMNMRKQGYTLVGVEQTANSKSLTQYEFPEKTLLLLGNEKEGIPVELIQLLDVCVEIPQLGVIRSLNVHVSGALLIWEYTRQQLLRET